MILLLASKPSRIALRHSSSNCRLRSYSSITNCSGGKKRQQKRNRTATKHLRHPLLVSDSAKAHVELLWGRRLGQSLIAELFTLNQVSVLKKVSAINPPFPTAFMQSQGVTVTLSSQQFRSVLSLFLWAPTAPKQCCVALHRA